MNSEIIISTEGVCGGRPRINGHRIEVDTIVELYMSGASVDEIIDLYDLSSREVIAALHYADICYPSPSSDCSERFRNL